MSEVVTTRLTELEEVIERGLDTFVEVGKAIREIRDSRLYKEEFPTFEEYCRERWGWSRRHTNRTIEAADTVGVLGPIGPKPQNEAQARELASLAKSSPEDAAEVWKEVTEKHGDKLTATDVRQAVTERVEFKDRLAALPEQTRAVLEQADEGYDKHRNLLRNSNQMDHLARIADKRGDEVAAEVAERALTTEHSNVFKEYEKLKEERGEPPETIGEIFNRLPPAEGEEPWPGPPKTSDEEKRFYKINEWMVGLTRLDPENVASFARDVEAMERSIRGARGVIAWFETYAEVLEGMKKAPLRAVE